MTISNEYKLKSQSKVNKCLIYDTCSFFVSFKEAALLITSHATNKANPQKENNDNITWSCKKNKRKQRHAGLKDVYI